MRKPPKEPEFEPAETPRNVAIWVVITCAVLVVMNLLAWVFFRDDVVAKRKMTSMAREYYENYLYDSWNVEGLAEYAEKGLPEVTLRVLLSYDGGKNLGEEAYFERAECDSIATGVKFYPEEPFGRKDYRMEIDYSCNFD